MFNLEKHPVISLIGSGGKTSILNFFGKCSSEKREKVILTTTTKVFPMVKEGIPLILEQNREKRGKKVEELLKIESVIQVGSGKEGEKIVGIEPEAVHDFLKSGADRVFAEADGSRGLPFKFPSDYEPVLPVPSGKIFLVVGTWALGQRFSEKNFHRPELARNYLGWEEGKLIEGEQITELLLHPRSYLPRLRDETISVILNGIQGPWQENEARRISAILLKESQVERVYILNLYGLPPRWKLIGERKE